MNQVSQAQFRMIPLQFTETEPDLPRRSLDKNAPLTFTVSIKNSVVVQSNFLCSIKYGDTSPSPKTREHARRASRFSAITTMILWIFFSMTERRLADIQRAKNHQRITNLLRLFYLITKKPDHIAHFLQRGFIGKLQPLRVIN